MAKDSKEIFYEEVGTPDPNEYALAVYVNRSMIRGNMTTFAVGTQLCKTPPWMAKSTASAKGYGNYIFTLRWTGNDEYVVYYFAKPKTAAQLAIPFRTTPVFGNHYWHPILKALVVLRDPSFPASTMVPNPAGGTGFAFANRYYIRQIYVPAANEGTLFLTDEFLSPTPFTIGKRPVPQPAEVSYDILGKRGSFQECLHDRIEIQGIQTATTNVFGNTNSAASGVIKGQVFNSTNPPGWSPYVLSEAQNEGPTPALPLYHKIRKRVIPPNEPEAISRIG